MSTSAAQYAQFREQVSREGTVFTFTAGGEYLVYRVNENDVIPFWSSRRRLIGIQKRLVKYREYQISEMPLREFLRWLPVLEAQGIHVGVNWSGERLTGYDVRPEELAAAIQHCLGSITTDRNRINPDGADPR